MSHALWGHPRQMGHVGEFGQNVIHWRREWQTTSVFLPWESHGQYEKAKIYDSERLTPHVGRCPICYRRTLEKYLWKNEEAEPKRKQCPLVDVTGDGSKVWCCSGSDGIPAERFQILKDGAAKVLHSTCQQIWKTACTTGLEKVSLFPVLKKKAMPKNVQTTTQLHSSTMLVKLCSKFSKLVFNSMWTNNFQMFELDLEKAEEPGLNSQHPLDHRNYKTIPGKYLFLLHWLC